MAHLQINYTLSGCIVVPEGSTVTNTGTGIRLPDGRILKVWEQFELHTADDEDPRNLTFDEVTELGCFFDGDMGRFDDPQDINEGDQIWPPKETQHG